MVRTATPATRKRAAAASESTKLTRDDWLDAAFQAVVEGGFDQVRVLVLAGALGVTRGSFYWHFVDHAALLSALLARWHARETGIARALAESFHQDPQQDLERLLDAALSHGGANLEHMRFELALRGLGRRDPEVARMLLEVDELRLRVFEGKFLRLTGDARVAADLAALFYLAIVGSNQALSRPTNPPQTKDYLKGLITRYLIQHQVPSPAATQAAAA